MAFTDEEAFRLNQLSWDDRVGSHFKSAMYQRHVEELRGGGHCLEGHTLEALGRLGSLEGKSAIHLQCHMGMETLSLARLGAKATGLDFSQPAIDVGRGLADELGLGVDFICANVYDTLEHVEGKFDLVLVTVGALCWLPDIERWAKIVGELLKPGGMLCLWEVHPLADVLDDHPGQGDSPDSPMLVVKYPYFHEEGIRCDEDGSYTDKDAKFEHNASILWTQPLGDVINALVGAGMRIDRLDESPLCVWPAYDMMEEVNPNRFKLPGKLRDTLPITYTLIATKGE